MKTRSTFASVLFAVLLLCFPQLGRAAPDGAKAACGSGAFNLQQAIADQAQMNTLGFSALPMITGNLAAQSFFPPGKLADYWGFQYLRDNDPDNMGHNTSFLTRVACNVLFVLDDAQVARLKALAASQVAAINEYGYRRFTLMKAFRRLVDGDLPASAVGLDRTAVATFSADLYALDGQISFDRAALYADIYRSLSGEQRSYLDAMVGAGFNSWPDKTTDDVKDKTAGLGHDEAVAVMTYAGDMFSWYAGCVAADVYFCPERHGTYYGGFYMKDAPAIGHEGYSIDEQLTATAGAALCDSSKGYVTAAQAAIVAGLVDKQRDNLYEGTSNIVQARTAISNALRSLVSPVAPTSDQLAQVQETVLEQSRLYGRLDGEDNADYASAFARLRASLSAPQLDQLFALRRSILAGVYADGTPYDFTVCSTPYLFSAPIADQSVLDPYISNTDFLFDVLSASFTSAPAAATASSPVVFMAGASGGTPPYTFSWDLGGTAASGPSPSATFAAGSYPITLTVHDAAGYAATASKTLVVLPAAVAPPPVADGTLGTAGARFSRSAAVPGQIDVSYDAASCAGGKAVVVYGALGDYSGYAGCAQPDAGSGGRATIPAAGLGNVWFLVLWTDGATAGPAGDADDGAGPAARTWNAAGLCGIVADDHSAGACRGAPALDAAFSFAPAAPAVGQTTTFTDGSTGAPTIWNWDFGDGTVSGERNPSHAYAAPGAYTVVLTAANAFGFRQVSRNVVVSSGSPGVAGGFDGSVILGAPTETSIEVSVYSADQSGAVAVQYGSAPGAYDHETAAAPLTAGVPTQIAITGLNPDARCYYRLDYRSPDGAGSGPTEERSFHTARPAGASFTFTVQADSHLDANSSLAVYRATLANALAASPDFHVDLGDTFMCEKYSQPFTATVQAAPDQATVVARYRYERDNFGALAHSVPLYLVNGNHEGEAGWLQDGTANNVAVWAAQARRQYYVNPVPDGVFYSGDAEDEPFVGKRASWYAWRWGDALFIVLDPFWNTTSRVGRDPWAMTLGERQYRWLEATLAASSATFKFVFIHDLVGGLDGQMRGGVEAAPYFEWGGRDLDGTDSFAAKRPGWDQPIHPLLVRYGVTAVFHGHDHFYARQELDGVVYQETPQPSAVSSTSGPDLAAASHYSSGTILSSSGHLRVTVAPDRATVEYVRTWLPADETAGRRNGEVADSWTVAAPAAPRPAADQSAGTGVRTRTPLGRGF